MRKAYVNPTVKIIFFSIIYMLTLQWIYVKLIVTRYAHYGFISNFSFGKGIISWLLFIPVPLLINKFRKSEIFSNQFLALILFLNYMPMLVMNIYMDVECMPQFVLYYFMLIVANLFMPEIKICIKKTRKLKILRSDRAIKIIGILLIALVFFIWAFYSHFNVEIGFGNVYEQRIEARNYSMPALMTYAFSMARAIVPLLAIYYLYRRNKLWFIIYSIVQMMIFFIDGSKSAFFLLLAGIMAYYVIRKYKKIISLFPIIFTGINTICILEKIVINTTNISDIIIRRSMFMPCLLNNYYYDFFSKNGMDYYRQSLGSILGPSKYGTSIRYIIGEVYFSDSNMGANNGLFSDAYANLGIIGMILLPILIMLVLKIMEGAADYLPQEVWAISAIQASIAFISSSFFTVLLTHGVLFTIVMLYLLSSNNYTSLLEKRFRDEREAQKSPDTNC